MKFEIPFLKKEVENDFDIWDCHTHIGTDIDGFSLNSEKLIKLLKNSKIEKAVVFPFHDINMGKDFSAPNDAVLEAYKKYPKKIIPFFRLNPKSPSWKKEAEKRRAQGFKGLKLHPRAQKFKLTDSKAGEVYDFLSENNLPLLVHTGLGMGKISTQVENMLEDFPKLRIILGHSGMSDLQNIIPVIKSARNKHVYLETSTVQAYDLFEIFDRVDSSRIMFGSDVPYGDMEAAIQLIKGIAESFSLDSKSLDLIFKKNLENCIYNK